MPKVRKNVWGVACPKCHAPTGVGCRDLRSQTGLLFGRRTHRERAKALEGMAAEWIPAVRNEQTYTMTFTTGTGSTLVTDEQFANTWTTTGNNWITMAPTTTTITASPQDVTWGRWVNTGTMANLTFQYNQVWNGWVEDDETRIALAADRRRQADELQARREQHARERLAAEQARMEDQLVAHQRGLELLDDLLTDAERIMVEQFDKIAVEGTDGHLYWIEMHRQTVHGNIVRTDEHGCSLGRACVAPAMYDGFEVLPTADGWVGQYLGLKFDTEEFLSHANWSSVRPCERPAVGVA